MNDVEQTMKACECEEARRNRRLKMPLFPTYPPNEDGEIVCRFCWEVVATGRNGR